MPSAQWCNGRCTSQLGRAAGGGRRKIPNTRANNRMTLPGARMSDALGIDATEWGADGARCGGGDDRA